MVKRILRISLIVGLLLYMVVALSFTSRLAETRQCRGIGIELNDEQHLGFVKAEELALDLGSLYTSAAGRPLCQVRLDSIEERLMASDKIETVQAVILTNDSIRVSVTPLVPVARVFDGNKSYYINRDGKRIGADARYHVDVPVLSGDFTRKQIDPVVVLPLVDYIENNPKWRMLISMIDVHDLKNIYLVANIRGQVVKFGDLSAIDNKFERLDRFYRRVLPYKGWNYYDTIAVKWGGQVVASRSDKRHADHHLPIDTLPQSAYDEAVPILAIESSPTQQ